MASLEILTKDRGKDLEEELGCRFDEGLVGCPDEFVLLPTRGFLLVFPYIYMVILYLRKNPMVC